MTALPLGLAFLAAATALIWASRHWLIWRERNSGFVLDEDYPIDQAALPPVTVIVAAKDERANIEFCVRSMLQQDYPQLELIVCNDRSTDATGKIVESIAADDDRVRLINITDLPAGWLGKSHAMQHGTAAARYDRICMIDADCRQTSTRSLAAAMQYALDTEADLLSVLPELEMKTLWEKIVQPVCSGVMMIWFLPEKVNDPAKPNAYANGAFMLMKRSAYEAVGRHEAVKSCINEDMHLARLVKAGGLNLRVVRNRQLYSVRMYETLGQMLAGWSRIFYGTFDSPKRLTASLLVLIVMGLVPYLAAGLGLGFAAAGATWAWWACGLAGAASVTMQLSVCVRFYGLLGSRPSLGCLYPLGCLIAIYAVLIAMSKYRKGAQLVWRDTAYSTTDLTGRRAQELSSAAASTPANARSSGSGSGSNSSV